MRPLTLAEVAEAVGGTVSGDATVEVRGASADSRAVAASALFVAIPGERVDGHDYIDQAAAAGAAAALSTRPSTLPTVVVTDPVTALGSLARWLVAGLPDLTVVAVTGSSGKTSTKDLLAAVMARRGPVVAPAGSMNTEVGLPLTALRCDRDTRSLVAEMGARGTGHIAYLCELTPPDISVVLNVGTAHLGEFGSREAIAAAKGEIVEALRPEGVAILNADDPLVAAMAERTSATVLTYGASAGADLRIQDLTLDALARPSFTLTTATEAAAVTMKVSGEHSAWNGAAAVLAGVAAGVPLADAAAALSAAEAVSRWRMEITTTADGVTIVNDAYNANPSSMAAALKSLAEIGRAGSGRTWAVLGEMKELGPDSATEHDLIGRLAVRLNIGRLVAVGDGARPLHLGAAHEGSWDGESVWVADKDAAVALLRAQVVPGDVVLVKGSRSVGLESVAEALLDGSA